MKSMLSGGFAAALMTNLANAQCLPFVPAGHMPLPDIARSVGVADIDNDGDLDLVVGAECWPGPPWGRLRTYLNNGTGVFTLGASYVSENRNACEMSIVDLDGDGWLDIVASNIGIGPGRLDGISIWRGSGGGVLAVC